MMVRDPRDSIVSRALIPPSRQGTFGLRKALTVLALGGMLLWNGGASADPDAPGRLQLAQASAPRPPNATSYSIGSVATLQGSASVTRSSATSVLKVKDAIFKGDVLQTAVNGTLGIAFDDATTFSLRPNSRIAVDDFVYQENGSHNLAAFDVVRGTVAFVAGAVAKTGDMKIVTPTATIGIRGTTGVIEVAAAGTAGTAAQST